MSRLILILVFCLGCSDRPVENEAVVPEVDFSEGPVITMASTAQIGFINDALSDGASVSKGYAIRSETHDFAHFIMARIDGVDGDSIFGLWFMYDGMDIPGERFAVNDLAAEHTSFERYEEDEGVETKEREEVVILDEFVRNLPARLYP